MAARPAQHSQAIYPAFLNLNRNFLCLKAMFLESAWAPCLPGPDQGKNSLVLCELLAIISEGQTASSLVAVGLSLPKLPLTSSSSRGFTFRWKPVRVELLSEVQLCGHELVWGRWEGQCSSAPPTCSHSPGAFRAHLPSCFPCPGRALPRGNCALFYQNWTLGHKSGSRGCRQWLLPCLSGSWL